MRKSIIKRDAANRLIIFLTGQKQKFENNKERDLIFMKTSRIVLPLVLVALFVFLPFSQSVALVDRQDSPIVDCEEVIRTVYTKMNGIADRSADEAYKALRFDKKTKAYLDSKISLTEYNDTLYELGKDDYAVQVKLLGVHTENGRRTAEYQVIENFKYTNTRERSVKSEVVYVTLDAENTICDFYCPTAGFDMTVRGNLSLNELSENEIATKANELKAQI